MAAKISAFQGLNNVSDSLRLGMTWLKTADNIDITDTGAVKKRSGFAKKLSGAITGSFSTFDFSRMYIVDGGVLKAVTKFNTATPLVSGLSLRPMHWTEINGQVYYNNGIDSGIILPDNTVLPWAWVLPLQPTVAAVTGQLPAGIYRVCCTFTLPDGRMTGSGEVSEIVLGANQALQISGLAQNSNVYIAPADSTVFQYAGSPSGSAMVWNSDPTNLGAELQTLMMYPIPAASIIQAWRGRMYAVQYMPSDDQTVIWMSQPLGFHLFDLGKDFFLVPGKVEMLAPHDGGLIIGTDTRVYAYTQDKIEEIAPYGVVPGWHWAEDDGRILFWSKRGLCAALPFSNLTEQVSVAPGLSAGGVVVRSGGQKRYLVALQRGGAAFNSYS